MESRGGESSQSAGSHPNAHFTSSEISRSQQLVFGGDAHMSTESDSQIDDSHDIGADEAKRDSLGSPSNPARNKATACRRCRQQKLRCTRELPSCKRCSNIGAVCSYPPPPERKLLAAKRMHGGNVRPRRESEGLPSRNVQSERRPHTLSVGSVFGAGSSLSQKHEHMLLTGSKPAAESDTYRGLPALAVSSSAGTESSEKDVVVNDVAVPTSELALFLFEIYFERLYNASLLFHKASLVADYIHRRTPKYVSFSIFALATIFLQEETLLPRLQERCSDQGIDLGAVLECGRNGHAYATVASRLVLSQADQPTLETVQTCQNLGLFWFAVGQLNKTDIHTHLAYRISRLLAFHKTEASEQSRNDVGAEIRRRCFWSCWITNCISQDNADLRIGSFKNGIDLALPSDEASFNSGSPEPQESFIQYSALVAESPGKSLTSRPSIMAEMVKVFSLWWEIQHFVKQDNDITEDNATDIAALVLLDRKLENFQEKLHPILAYQGPNTFASPMIDPYRLFGLHCIAHVCACVLHSSVVPLFSNNTPNPQMSKKLVRLSAEEAVKHSGLLVEMAEAFLPACPDKSRLSAMTGYAVFVSVSIQFKALLAQGKLESHGIGHCRAAISILETLKGYWAPLQNLWTALMTLLRTSQLSDHELIVSRRLSGLKHSYYTNIEQIISQSPNETGGEVVDLYTYVANQDPETKTRAQRVGASKSPSVAKSSPANTSHLQSKVNESDTTQAPPPAQQQDQSGIQYNYQTTSVLRQPDQNAQNSNQLHQQQAFGADQSALPQSYMPSEGYATGAAYNFPMTGTDFWWDQNFEQLEIVDPFPMWQTNFST